MSAVNILTAKPNSSNPQCGKCCVSAGVSESADGACVPVVPVRFYCQTVVSNKEVNPIPLYFVFRQKANLQVFQRLAHSAFKLALSTLKANALLRTEPTISRDGRLAKKGFVAPKANLGNISLQSLSVARMGAIQRILGSHAVEGLAARLASVRDLRDATFVLTITRAVYARLSVDVSIRREFNSALGTLTRLWAIARGLIAVASTKANYTISAWSRPERIPAILTKQVFKIGAAFSVCSGHLEVPILPRSVHSSGGFS